MSNTIPTPNRQEHLAGLTAKAKSEHLAVGHALGNALQHAMNCGDALLAIREMVPDGKWQAYLRDQTDIPARSARVYQQVAKSRPLLEREGSAAAPISIAQALAYLRDPEAKRPTSRATNASKLNLLAWTAASPDARRRFLDGIGLIALLAALPPTWRAEIDRRVNGQRSAAISPLGDKATKALRSALSHLAQKTDQDRASALAGLGGIGNLLAAHGLDLHDIEITVAVAARHKAKAAAKAAA
jgi:hypothetical protein